MRITEIFKTALMEKAMLLLILFALSSFAQDPPDVVILSGQIANQNSDSILVRSRSFKRTIQIKEDGTFRDTFSVTEGTYNLYDGNESTNIFLRNGFNLHLTLDTKEFDESIKYSGIGSEHSNFLAKKSLVEEKLLDFDALSEIEDLAVLENTLEKIKSQLTDFYDSNNLVDSTLIQSAKKNLEPMLSSYFKYLVGSIELKTELPEGSPSPTFTDYENVTGTTTSLGDLRGKYLYVDVWATWCGPCKAEIPHLKELEKEYHGRNIQFLSLSVDDDRTHGGSWEKARADWKAMIVEKELGGIQLFAPNGWQSDFVTAYKIKGIPRFILIDPDGNVITPDAPKPSSAKLKELLDSLKI